MSVGTNPVVDRRECWKPCRSCFKCEDQGKFAKCASCPGRADFYRRMYNDPDSYCDCRNGILRHRTQAGRLIVRKFLSSPYGGSVRTDAVSEDEEQWNAYIQERREFLQNPTWDPIKMPDGSGASEWSDKFRVGRGW